jgi:2-polyprenyl-6-methoxyphenol hydroxylase-like FAD-dependent oxidoreductase
VKAIVVGGGIGGLTAAIALGRAGVEAAVFERAEELREIGAGISLWSNAVKALKKLGVYVAIREAGGAELGGEIRSWRGERISRITADQLRARFGGRTWPSTGRTCRVHSWRRYRRERCVWEPSSSTSPRTARA